MKQILFVLTCFVLPGVVCANAELGAAIDNVRASCGGISNELNHMKTMAGINTAVTGVGTVAGGVALGTGIAKANVDEEVSELEEELRREIDALNALANEQDGTQLVGVEIDWADLRSRDFGDANQQRDELLQKQAQVDKLNNKSEKLGDWRTGTVAVSAATNIAGAVIAGTNKVKGDLKGQIDECVASVKVLSNVWMQARLSKSASDDMLARAEKIVSACGAWENLDISSINNRSTGATIASGIGAATGVAGTVTSAVANSEPVRSGDAEKEKNLNTAANVLAGGTMVASGVATVFNATQISAIKRAVTVADVCQGAL